MNVYWGKGASAGVSYGRLLYLENRTQIERKSAEYSVEKRRIDAAVELSVAQLERLRETSRSYLNEYELGIFDVQKQLLTDENYISEIDEIIKNEGCNAEYAVEKVLDELIDKLKQINDETVLSRLADVKDVFTRIIDNLLTPDEGLLENTKGSYIIASKELLPSVVLKMDLSKVSGIISKYGSEKGHLAIIARALNIPYICNISDDMEFSSDENKIMAVVDGYEGKVIINPDEITREIYVNKVARAFNENAIYSEMKGLESVSKDGKRLNVLCNISLAEEVDAVISNDAEGVGLLRTEFLFMQDNDFPSEEKQYHYYSYIIRKMANKKVIIRTLDIGEDKTLSYIDSVEDGGMKNVERGVAFSLKHEQIFKTQLRAIYRASAALTPEKSDVSILFPMVKTVEELKRCLFLCEEVQKEMKNSQIPFNENVKKGIMIECMLAMQNLHEFAELSDFFSVGTNDLHREIARLAECSEDSIKCTEKEQIIKLIREVSAVAHEHNIPVGICGEMASDESVTEQFLNIGIDELSVKPADVLKLRYRIRNL